jgi:quercetin dioxygenase-like cupin family protein
MPDYEVIDPEQLPELEAYQAPFCTASGTVRSRFRAPEGFGQFVVYADIGAGAEIAWSQVHGDEGIVVLDGEVEVDGQSVPKKGAIVVEAGAVTRLRATVDSQLLHLGSTVGGPQMESVLGPPRTDHPAVHLFGPDGKASRPYEVLVNTFYADAQCEGCRIALFRVNGSAPYVVPSHSHSAHEMLTVTEGSLQVGRDTATPLMTLAIPADRRYGFRSKGPWEFVNFRLDGSYFTGLPGSAPIKEGIGAFAEPS